ncbi:MAG: DUF1559 domain-containing protein [Gemmataceae bacterium]|nr:DUF1559 domain-containing protein [Gemmataceae bacterium]
MFNNFVTNVPVRTYLDPARGGPGFSTVNWAGAATDYSVNLTVFGARDSGWNQLVNVPNSNYSVATIPDGSSNTMFVGSKAITPQQVANRQGNNWDEGIITGGAGGTGRAYSWQGNGTGCGSRNAIFRDRPTGGCNGGSWGSPYAGGALFLSGDGSVRTINYSASGTQAMDNYLFPNDGLTNLP